MNINFHVFKTIAKFEKISSFTLICVSTVKQDIFVACLYVYDRPNEILFLRSLKLCWRKGGVALTVLYVKAVVRLLMKVD